MKGSIVAVAAVAVLGVQANELSEASVEARMAANPIRKVVTMLQAIQKKVEAEAEKETKMHEKYMCYCQNGASTLQKSIDDAGVKMPDVASQIKEAEAQHIQLGEDLTSHRSDRVAAKDTMAKATSVREKEAATFAAYKAEADANIGSIRGAVKALVNGMSGTFLQTRQADVLRKVLQSQNMLDADRQEIAAFLSTEQGSDYVPSSGDITGILKQLDDEMSKDLADTTSAEKDGIKIFGELMAAKTKEVNAATAAIEQKTVRQGEVAVSIAQMKNDLDDTQAALLEDTQFLADLDKNCATKAKEWDGIVKTRGEEVVALAETIKMLQDDDALELFKKTLPSAAASLVQQGSAVSSIRAKALGMIREVQRKASKPGHLDFLVLALQGKKIGFAKVIKMIDNMVSVLKKEQTDDDDKKEYCGVSFDAADDKKKGLERSISDSEAAIEVAQESLSTFESEIKGLKQAIKDLDKQVAEATEQRKAEHEDFNELMAQDSAAKELLGVAKNRLNKFYNPKLYKAAPKRELSEQDRIAVSMGGTAPPTPAPGGIAGTGVAVLAQVSAHTDRRQHSVDAPAPPPDAVPAYNKKSEETTGVVAMMDILIKDLDKEMTEAETEEKDAQADYEQMTKDSAAKRATDSKSLSDKMSAKADTEAALQAHQEDKVSAGKELMATTQYISSLHAECDWLVKYYDMRKEARSSEIDALGKAKAVLSGADFSLMQTGGRSLRGTA